MIARLFLNIFLWFMTTTVWACQVSEGEVLVVEENYEGPITIFYGNPQGVSPIYENDDPVYRIPATGTLLAKPNRDNSWNSWAIYYSTKDGKQKKIPNLPTIEDIEDGKIDSNQVYIYRQGYCTSIMPDQKSGLRHVPGYTGKDTVGYICIALSKPKNWDSIAAAIDSHMLWLLERNTP